MNFQCENLYRYAGDSTLKELSRSEKFSHKVSKFADVIIVPKLDYFAVLEPDYFLGDF